MIFCVLRVENSIKLSILPRPVYKFSIFSFKGTNLTSLNQKFRKRFPRVANFIKLNQILGSYLNLAAQFK